MRRAASDTAPNKSVAHNRLLRLLDSANAGKVAVIVTIRRNLSNRLIARERLNALEASEAALKRRKQQVALGAACFHALNRDASHIGDLRERRAVQKALDNDSYRAASERIGTEIKASSGLQGVEAAIESLVTTENASVA